MARLNKEEFIKSMQGKLAEQLEFINGLSGESTETLNQKPKPDAWNTLECVDHMNRALLLYTDQILPMKLKEGKEEFVTIGWLGRFFAEGMRPKGEKILYKTPTTKVFKPSDTNYRILSDFKQTLESCQLFLEKNRDKEWRGKKATSALGPLVKFNIAEAYNFLLAHNERHILQAKIAMNRV